MYCNECGNKLKDDDIFCTRCGTPITEKDKIKSEKNKEIKIKLWQVILAIIIIASIILGFIIVNAEKSIISINDTNNEINMSSKENSVIKEEIEKNDTADNDNEDNYIRSISIDIHLDSNGNAKVTEEWNCNVISGTECYHPYYNLGNSVISNLAVSDLKQSYTIMNSWNVSDSFNDKAYKCGINKTENGVELCWGISEYGANTFTIKYDISNFVAQLNDSQMIYWTLIPYDFSNSIGNATIKIHSDAHFKDTIDVWGYGNYGGLCYVSNGAIYMNSDGELDKSEYMTILAKLPKNMFHTKNKFNENFNHYYNMAEEN